MTRRFVLLAVSMGVLLGGSEVNAGWKFWNWFKRDKGTTEQINGAGQQVSANQKAALKSEREVQREAEELRKKRAKEQKERERDFVRSQKKKQEELEKQQRDTAKAYKKMKREREKKLRDHVRKLEKERRAYVKQHGKKVDSSEGFFLTR